MFVFELTHHLLAYRPGVGHRLLPFKHKIRGSFHSVRQAIGGELHENELHADGFARVRATPPRTSAVSGGDRSTTRPRQTLTLTLTLTARPRQTQLASRKMCGRKCVFSSAERGKTFIAVPQGPACFTTNPPLPPLPASLLFLPCVTKP